MISLQKYAIFAPASRPLLRSLTTYLSQDDDRFNYTHRCLALLRLSLQGSLLNTSKLLGNTYRSNHIFPFSNLKMQYNGENIKILSDYPRPGGKSQ